ncbi:hypothetical protein I4U23_001461 [Adineta vaga]|nr:hypothetical protein I4U23_001461 [Adineta vaga]
MHGELPYKGAYAEQNLTAETIGFDPTRIVLSALPEGLPTKTTVKDMNAVNFLILKIHLYSGQVSILALGPLTNIALAIKTQLNICKKCGYLDANIAQIIGSLFQADPNSDFNILFDPEASSSMVLTAHFPSIVLVGHAAQLVTFDSSYIDSITTTNTPLITLIAKYYPRNLPMWYEATTATILYSDLITDAFSAYADIDISFSSPFYGQIHIRKKALAPSYVRNVSFIQSSSTSSSTNLLEAYMLILL